MGDDSRGRTVGGEGSCGDGGVIPNWHNCSSPIGVIVCQNTCSESQKSHCVLHVGGSIGYIVTGKRM